MTIGKKYFSPLLFLSAFLVVLITLLIQVKFQPIGFMHADIILPTLVVLSFFLGAFEVAILSLFSVFFLNFKPFISFEMIFLLIIPFLSFWIIKIFPAKIWIVGFIASVFGILIMNVNGGLMVMSQNIGSVTIEFLISLLYGAVVFWGFYRFFEFD
jgi:hypothetical protein